MLTHRNITQRFHNQYVWLFNNLYFNSPTTQFMCPPIKCVWQTVQNYYQKKSNQKDEELAEFVSYVFDFTKTGLGANVAIVAFKTVFETSTSPPQCLPPSLHLRHFMPLTGRGIIISPFEKSKSCSFWVMDICFTKIKSTSLQKVHVHCQWNTACI